MVQPRWTRFVAWGALSFFGLMLLGAVVVLFWTSTDNAVEVGASSEPLYALSAGMTPVRLSDTTLSWGLGGRPSAGSPDPLGGGAVLADLDRDGDLDLVVANGDTRLFSWEGRGFGPGVDLDVADAVAVGASDLDGDGWVDVLVARSGPDDVVLWGQDQAPPGRDGERTEIPGSGASGGLLAADLNGDGLVDIFQLGRGGRTGTSDVIWAQSPSERRTFSSSPLPDSDRLSLAAEIVDIDLDGLADIWVTRDIGWDTGGDSLYSRQGDPTGDWHDISAEMGSALEIDGMGVTVADLDGDLRLDAYVSDIGDNEFLVGGVGGFSSASASGAARIRPPGADASVVSSSWGSAVTDLNLDGIADLVVVNGGFPDGGVRNKIPGTTVEVSDEPAILLGLGEGRFAEVWPDLGIDVTLVGRGLSVGDIEGDGDDDVIVVALDGRILALRNDSTAPSLTIVAAPGCPLAGTLVKVRGDHLSFTALLAPHAYGGAHSPEIVVGTGGVAVRVEVTPPGRDPVLISVDASATRRRISVDCAD